MNAAAEIPDTKEPVISVGKTVRLSLGSSTAGLGRFAPSVDLE